jgi:hypothetical protein
MADWIRHRFDYSGPRVHGFVCGLGVVRRQSSYSYEYFQEQGYEPGKMPHWLGISSMLMFPATRCSHPRVYRIPGVCILGFTLPTKSVAYIFAENSRILSAHGDWWNPGQCMNRWSRYSRELITNRSWREPYCTGSTISSSCLLVLWGM